MLRKIRSIRRMIGLFLVILCLLLCVLTLPRIFRSRGLARKRLAARLMRRHLQAMAWVSGLKIHVDGALPPENSSFILLANHVSYWDIIALGSLRPMGFMAKDNIAGWPFLGAVTRHCNTLYVKREEVRDRWRALRQLQKCSQDLPYCVFPEGTTTAAVSPTLALWRRGNVAVLRDPGLPIWLAGLHYRDHRTQAWIDDDALLPHIWKVLQAPRIDLMVTLRQLESRPAESLQQVSIQAWNQTARLCRQSQDLTYDLPPLRVLKSLNAHDSAAS